MPWTEIVALVMALAAVLYLTVALLAPEKVL